MSNVLQFTLGLATGGFLTGAQRAQSAMTGLVKSGLALPGLGVALGGVVGGFTSVSHAVEKTFAQFEKGAALEQLHKRTGETVENLYKLQKGFAAAGVAGESVPTVVFQMQKALGGFNEFGEPTKDVFAAIGLEVEKLKGMSAPEALTTILGQIARLNNSEATNITAKIFGRGGAGDALQLARSLEGVKSGMEGAAQQAAVFARNAAAFERIELGLKKIKNLANSFWLGIAEGAGPAVQAAINALSGLKLANLGERFGRALATGLEVIRQGRIGDVFALSFESGIERAMKLLAGFAEIIPTLLADAFSSDRIGAAVATATLAAAGKTTLSMAKGVLGPIEEWMADQTQKAAAQRGQTNRTDLQTGAQARASLNQSFAADEKILQEVFEGAMIQATERLPATLRRYSTAFGKMFGGTTEAGQRLDALFAEIRSKIPGIANNEGVNDPLSLIAGMDKSKGGRNQSQASNLERIGAVFSFGQMGATDYTRKTADNTGQMVNLLREISKRINQGPAVPDFTNIA